MEAQPSQPNLLTMNTLFTYLLRLISNINNSILGPVLKPMLEKDGLTNRDFVFFMTGGAATTFYTSQPIHVNDIDCSLVMNPNLTHTQKYNLYALLINHIILNVIFWLNQTSDIWPGIIQELSENGIVLDSNLSEPQKFKILHRGYTINNLKPEVSMGTMLDVYRDIPFNTLKPGCPFRLEIQTNVSFKEVHPDSSVTSLNLQVFLISLKLRTPIHRLDSGRLSPFTHVSPLENPSLGSNGRLSPNLSKLINTMNYSIFDISIFKPSKETNSYDYDLSLLVNPLKAIPIAPYLSGLIPVANPIYLYINQLSASKTSSHINKQRSREFRSNILYDYISRIYKSPNSNRSNIFSYTRSEIRDMLTVFNQWFLENADYQYRNDYRFYDYENIFHSLIQKLNALKGGYKSKQRRVSLLKKKSIKYSKQSKTYKKKKLT